MTSSKPIGGRFPGGFLIAIEGIDGAGKTTLARSLRARIEALGADCVMTKEPTQGQYGQRLRDSAQQGRLTPDKELELLILDRREHVETLLQPSLESGKAVILDRYYLSNAAYQGACGLNVADILLQNEAFAPKPDLLLILDIPPDVGISRILARGDKPNAFETVGNLNQCRAIFLGMAGRANTHIIDASLSADDVLDNCWRIALLGIGEAARNRFGFTPEAGEAVLGFVGTTA